MSKQRAIFLDRDGVINVNRPDHVRAWQEFVFESHSLEAFARLAATDFRIIVITNQSGIARGHMTHATVQEIHSRLVEQVARVGARIDRVYYCPHLPEDACACRKPQPEMLLRGQAELDLDLENSYLVGDWVDDILAARSARVTPILVRTGRGELALREMRAQNIELPQIAVNMYDAVSWLIARETRLEPSVHRHSESVQRFV